MERENEHPAAPGRRAGAWIKKNTVLVIALCAAAAYFHTHKSLTAQIHLGTTAFMYAAIA